MRLAGLRGVDNGAVLGAAAVAVLDHAARLLAGAALLAGRTIGHTKVQLEIAVKLGRDMDLDDRELVDVLAALAAEGWAFLRLGVADTGDVLAAGTATAVHTGAAPIIRRAREAAPGEVLVGAERTRAQVAKGVAVALVIGALLLAVLGVELEVVLRVLVAGVCAQFYRGLHTALTATLETSMRRVAAFILGVVDVDVDEMGSRSSEQRSGDPEKRSSRLLSLC